MTGHLRSAFYLLTAVFLLAAANPLRAQDTLITVQGDILAVKLLEISNSAVTYLPTPADTSQTISMAAREVFIIKFRNGTKKVFPEHLTTPSAPTRQPFTADELGKLGIADARKYYHPKGYGAGTGIVTILSPVAGLVMVLVAGTPSPPDATTTSNSQLITEGQYTAAYQKEAKRIKKSKSLQGFLIGVSTYVVLIAALVNAD